MSIIIRACVTFRNIGFFLSRLFVRLRALDYLIFRDNAAFYSRFFIIDIQIVKAVVIFEDDRLVCGGRHALGSCVFLATRDFVIVVA